MSRFINARNVRIATAQFEHRSGDKPGNLSVIRKLTAQAAASGAKIIAFHECCISGYAFARRLTYEELLAMAEPVPGGESVQALVQIAHDTNTTILAGLFEKDTEGRIYNAYLAVDGSRVIANHRKLHPFISAYLCPGDRYTVFDLQGWKCGILTCYDNNVIENVRATALLGAQIVFMPHVTMCTPSPRPGAGFVDPKLWENRFEDPTSVRLEFLGMKGREWLMKWLPSRAYDNGIYVAFSNAIGMDDDQLKNGCSMIVDPFGDILAECRELGDDFAHALCTPGKLTQAGGYRYRRSRRPELYREILGQAHTAQQAVAWLDSPGSQPD